jgi:ATP-dependent Clp protease ATP-binding subunit ClpA
MVIGREVEELLHKVFVRARTNGTRTLLPEHILQGLLSAESLSEVFSAMRIDREALDHHLNVIVNAHINSRQPDDDDDISPSHEFQRVIQRAILRVMKDDPQRDVSSFDMLIALCATREPSIARVLIESGLSAEKLIEFEPRV